MNRVGDWFQTYTGAAFYVLDPRPDDVRLMDIAHHLAMQCRYNGACQRFYSVAEHSVHVSNEVERRALAQGLVHIVAELAMWGLMHDAGEAYVGDMVRPLKRNMPAFRDAESLVMRAICERFGLVPDEPPLVKQVDTVLLATERRDIMGSPPLPWRSTENIEPLDMRLPCWAPDEAAAHFLARFASIRGGA
jgi:hypothetical protein